MNSPVTSSLKAAHHGGQGVRFTPNRRNAMPVVLLDANNISYLFELEQHAYANVQGSSFKPSQILDALSQPGVSTLVIPRSVLNESTNWSEHSTSGGRKTVVTGYLDVIRAGDGSSTLSLSEEIMNFPANRRFVQWLKAKQKAGLVRIYDNEVDLINAEYAEPKGGIAIVGSDLLPLRTPNEESAVTTRTERFNTRTNARTELKQLISDEQSGIGKGDSHLEILARMGSAFARNGERLPRFMHMSDDNGCKAGVESAAERGSWGVASEDLPVQPSLLQLMQALHQQGYIPARDLATMQQQMTQQLLRKSGDAVDPGIMPRMARTAAYKHAVANCLSWFNDVGLPMGAHVNAAPTR